MTTPSIPDFSMYSRLRYADAATEEKYKSQKTLPKSNDEMLLALPYAWHLMQSFTKIEVGILRVVTGSLLGESVPKDALTQLVNLFSFDERLRMVQRLIKTGDLVVRDEFKKIQAPGEFGRPEFGSKTFFSPTEAIRIAMSYRNILAHDGFKFGVSETENGFSHVPFIESSNNSTRWVHLYHIWPEPRLDGLAQISFHEFVWRLSNSLPFFIGPPMFEKPSRIESPVKFIETAIAKQKESQAKNDARKRDGFAELLTLVGR